MLNNILGQITVDCITLLSKMMIESKINMHEFAESIITCLKAVLQGIAVAYTLHRAPYF